MLRGRRKTSPSSDEETYADSRHLCSFVQEHLSARPPQGKRRKSILSCVVLDVEYLRKELEQQAYAFEEMIQYRVIDVLPSSCMLNCKRFVWFRLQTCPYPFPVYTSRRWSITDDLRCPADDTISIIKTTEASHSKPSNFAGEKFHNESYSWVIMCFLFSHPHRNRK